MDYSYYLRRIRETPVRILARKLLVRLRGYGAGQWERCSAFLFPDALTLQAFARVFPAAMRASLAKEIWARSNSCLMIADRQRSSFRKVFGGEPYVREILRRADKICDHEFDILGSGPVPLGRTIDWRQDFKSGHRWKLRYHKALWVYNPSDDSDIKVPWELSRFQHIPTLGKAFWLSRDMRYAEEFALQVADWMNKNPVEYGPNWKCPMDVAIRAVNWIYGYGFFYEVMRDREEFWEKFLLCLYEHGRFIRSNLEYDPARRGNHYLSNLVGLVYLGSLFTETEEGRAWLEFGTQELRKEMAFQVHADGTSYEMSTAYHHLVLELFVMGSIAAARRNQDPETQPTPQNDAQAIRRMMGEEFTELLEKMFEFVYRTRCPDGTSPLIGDHDDGRLHILAGYGSQKKDDFRHLLVVGGRLFERDEWLRAASPEGRETAWWLWPSGEFPSSSAGDGAADGLESRAYPQGGFYVMRHNEDFVLVRCGGVGLNGGGGHAHCDALSMEIWLGGQALIVDPGCYLYTADPKMRCLLRSTRYHNTVCVDGTEQNRFDGYNLFSMEECAFPRARQWKTGNDEDIFEGEHYGYERLEKGLVHRRRMIFDKRNRLFRWEDTLTASGPHRYEWNLHLAPGCFVAGAEPKADGEPRDAAMPVHLRAGERQFLLEANLASSPEVVEGWVSRSYGCKAPALILRWRVTAAGEMRAAFALRADN
ncbi:MAG: alginate lyase family protein [Acidobacteriota bacterium]|nr:MAG: alginate lyase family protein [Acidobacteriota bacterium]